MNQKQLLEIVALGESTTVEFKRKATTPQKIAKEISAMANTKGGKLFIGVDDDGRIVGVESEKGEMDMIQKASQFHIDPPIILATEIVPVKNKDVIVAYIPDSSFKPHKIFIEGDNGRQLKRILIRVGEQSILASSEMARLMTAQNNPKDKLTISIGLMEKSLFSYLDKYGRATVIDFANLVNISKRRAERLMIRLTRAGALQIHNDTNHDYFTLK